MIGRNAAVMHWIALLLPLLLLAHRGQAVDLPSSAEYLRRHCAAHRAVYEPLIDGYLSQFRDGFTVAQLLTLPSVYNGTRMQREFSGGMPLLYIIDGELRVDASLPKPGNKRLKNLEYFGMPVLEQLARRARLPDLALLYSPFDEPTGAPLPLFPCREGDLSLAFLESPVQSSPQELQDQWPTQRSGWPEGPVDYTIQAPCVLVHCPEPCKN